jgi:hypothetical protein
MMNNQTALTGDNWRKLETPFRFKVPVFSPVSSFSSPLRDRELEWRNRTRLWNALAEPSSFPFSVDIRPNQHHPRRLREHLATHDVLTVANTESYQRVGTRQTGVGRSSGNDGVTTTRRVDILPSKPRPLAQLSPGLVPVFSDRGGWGDFRPPPPYRRAKSLSGHALKKSFRVEVGIPTTRRTTHQDSETGPGFAERLFPAYRCRGARTHQWPSGGHHD